MSTVNEITHNDIACVEVKKSEASHVEGTDRRRMEC